MAKLLIDSDMAKMLRNCHECMLGYGGFCAATPSEVDERCPDEDRPDWCPMTELPEGVKCV